MPQLYMILKIIFKIIFVALWVVVHIGVSWPMEVAGTPGERWGSLACRVFSFPSPSGGGRQLWRPPRTGWYHLLPRGVQSRIGQHAAAVGAGP